jgi:two-component sensor histidine kinase
VPRKTSPPRPRRARAVQAPAGRRTANSSRARPRRAAARQGRQRARSSPVTAALREIARALSAAWDLDATLDLFAQKTTEVLGVDSCSIYLLDPHSDTLRLRASTGLARAAVGRVTLRLGEGLTGEAARLGQAIAAREAQKDSRFKLIPETHEKTFRSLLAAPLASQGRVIGALNVQTRQAHDFTPEQIELLSLVGDLAAGALEKASLYDSMQRQLAELTALARVSQATTSPLYLDEMLDVVTEMAARMMNAAVCAVLLVDDDGRYLVLRTARRLGRPYRPLPPVPIGQGIAGWVAAHGQPLASRDVREDPRYLNPELARAEGLVSLLSVPLIVRERVIGVLNCYTEERREFTEDQVARFSTLANQTALALENSRLATSAAVVREMHHRVKNNLQTVAMLLRMQGADSPDLSPRDALNESVNRILSIAAVHEALSERGFRLVDVKDVIARIAGNVAQSMTPPDLDLSLAVEGESVTLPSRAATVLALAVNELLQNALEHAFAGRQRGAIVVTLTHTAKHIEIEVADDGVGWPGGNQTDLPGQTLGLELLRTLLREDLKGALQIRSSRRGTRATVRLPHSVSRLEEA